MSNIIIAFSGGCFAGKTTTMNRFKEILGDNCILFSELIRESIKQDTSIDELRKSTDVYFNLQKEVISKKISQEKSINYIYNNKIILLDRSLGDSLFYYSFYIDKSKLNHEQQLDYNSFYLKLIEDVKNSFKKIYSYVFLFKPIKIENCEVDRFRPKNINDAKYFEYDQIKSNIDHFSKNTINFDLSVNNNIIHTFLENRISDYRINNLFEFYSLLNKNFLFDFNFCNNNAVKYFKECDDIKISFESLLFSNIFFLQKNINFDLFSEMLNNIKSLDKLYFGSFNHPIGDVSLNNVMIVNQSTKNFHNFDKENIKLYPSTSSHVEISFIIKKAIFKNKQLLNSTVPYITDLCKYSLNALDDIEESFKKCWHIFLKELELIQPSKIIVLDHQTSNFIKRNLKDTKFNKIPIYNAPNPVICKRVKEKEYVNMLKFELKK